MKPRFFLFCLLLLFFDSAFSQQQWTWVAGNQSVNTRGVYGNRGDLSPANTPGSRPGAATWTDKDGNFWLFGGNGFSESAEGILNDLWRYSPQTNEWAWEGGNKNVDTRGNYGIRGIPLPTNWPGARENAVSWTDNEGNFWLFGGSGFGSRAEEGLLNDLWKYSTTSKIWTWISGDNRVDQKGKYGKRNDASRSNIPGGRSMAASWKDPEGNLWLFGGRGYSSKSDVSDLNDVWKYSLQTNSWAWMKGDKSEDAEEEYGRKKEFNNENTPGGRRGSTAWVDKEGKFWLFGGRKGSSYFSDLWKYDRIKNQWAWMSGSNDTDMGPKYSTKGQPDKEGNPGSRTLATGWINAKEELWLFGGRGYNGDNNIGELNSVWKYSIATDEWTFLLGEISLDPSSVYGRKGEAAPENTPGGTANAASWKDQQGNFWLFGGGSPGGSLNQLWKLSFGSCADISGKISPASASICEDGTQVLTASGGSLYEWKKNDVVIAGQSTSKLTVSEPGTYSVIIKNGNCSAPAKNTSVITIANAPSGSITPESAVICAGASQVLTASGGTSYEWKRDGTTISGEISETITVRDAGTYSVIIKNGSCTGPASNTSIVSLESNGGMRYATLTTAPNVPVRINARAIGSTYLWQPAAGLDNASSPAPMATLDSDREYTVLITTEQQCTVTDTVLVKITASNTQNKIAVPTAFTPNRNGANDKLRPLGNIGTLTFFKVYNRWGNLVFETSTPGAGWDGTYKGVQQPPDTYTWIMLGTSESGEQVKQSGKTLLIR